MSRADRYSWIWTASGRRQLVGGPAEVAASEGAPPAHAPGLFERRAFEVDTDDGPDIEIRWVDMSPRVRTKPLRELGERALVELAQAIKASRRNA